MEQIVNNQAFEHIVEKIFLPLKYEDLIACELVNKMAGTILKNPLFWLKKWKLEGLSKENEEIWNKALRLTKDSELKTNIILYFRRVLLMGRAFIDVTCYIDIDVVINVVAEKLNQSKSKYQSDIRGPIALKDPSYHGICQLLASSRKIPWPCQILGTTEGGDKDFIHIFAPLIPNLDIKAKSSDPNCYRNDPHEYTPIYMAARKGYTKIVKTLAPLTNNPNASCEKSTIIGYECDHGMTPLNIATRNGHQEISNILASYVLI